MNNDLKTLFLNIIAGLITYGVTKFLDTNNQHLFSALAFVFYIMFIIVVAFFHMKNSNKPARVVTKNDPQKEIEKNIDKTINNNKPEIFHRILQTVTKLASQHVDATPITIGKAVGESPQIVLAYLNQMVANLPGLTLPFSLPTTKTHGNT